MTKRCMVKAMSRQDEGLFVTQVWFVFFLNLLHEILVVSNHRVSLSQVWLRSKSC